jgi:hypothetical protein
MSPRSSESGSSTENEDEGSSSDDEIDEDEADDVKEFLAGFGIATDAVDGRLAVRATILLRQLEGAGADLNKVRQSILMKSGGGNNGDGEPQPMDFDQLEALLAEEISSKDAKLAEYNPPTAPSV